MSNVLQRPFFLGMGAAIIRRPEGREQSSAIVTMRGTVKQLRLCF
jgi:hypothetical protein